jgi:hypothetical protein
MLMRFDPFRELDTVTGRQFGTLTSRRRGVNRGSA